MPFPTNQEKIIDINKNRKQVIGLSWKSNNQDYGHFRSIELKNIFDKISERLQNQEFNKFIEYFCVTI